MATCSGQWIYDTSSNIPHTVSGVCQTDSLDTTAVEYCDT